MDEILNEIQVTAPAGAMKAAFAVRRAFHHIAASFLEPRNNAQVPVIDCLVQARVTKIIRRAQIGPAGMQFLHALQITLGGGLQ
jgi:hypothetical protein